LERSRKAVKLEKSARGLPTRRRVRQRDLRLGPQEDAERFAQLRRALLGPEQTKINQLEERPGVAADTVADVLPEALAQTRGSKEEKLAIALEPVVTTAVGSIASRRPEFFGELLAPSLVAQIRKAVSDTLGGMLERFNELLDRSLSVRSLRWRVEAARTGRPFSEVVLMRTLKYRVEQVFLIHTNTSLVLQHVVDPSLQAQRPDEVAAMLAAIDSFGREAFGPMPAEAHLEKFTLGDLVVWISRDPLVTLAAVSRGAPSAEIGRQLTEARERVRVTNQRELARFAGDATRFRSARPTLESLLRTEQNPPPRRARVLLAVAALAIAGGITGVAWRSHAQNAAASRKERATIEALASTPGIVITSALASGGRERIYGLRDPLAPDPSAILATHGLPAVESHFTPFVSLDPQILQRRIEGALAPPPGVTVAVSDGSLRLAGIAPQAWVDAARRESRLFPGIEHYDESALRASETLDALREAASSLQAVAIPFETGQSRIDSSYDPRLRRAATLMKRGVDLAVAAHLGACVEVLGHADPPGTAERNKALSSDRASAVATRLEGLGIHRRHLRHRGEGVWEEAGERARSVTFGLFTSAEVKACGE
jgi:OOP family OmpA-OmpF porin